MSRQFSNQEIKANMGEKTIFFFLKILFICLRESKRTQVGGAAEEEGEAGSPPSRESNVGSIPGHWDRDPSRRQKLNWLSHPGALKKLNLVSNEKNAN